MQHQESVAPTVKDEGQGRSPQEKQERKERVLTQGTPSVVRSIALYHTVYSHVLFSNLRVEHFIFEKRKRSWVLRQHVPELHPRFVAAGEQLVI